MPYLRIISPRPRGRSAARGRHCLPSLHAPPPSPPYPSALADELERRKDDVASVEAFNTGKPLREAHGDVDDACAAFRYCARQALNFNTLYPQPCEALPAPEFHGSVRYEPTGVVGAICPWNFPLMMAGASFRSPRAAIPRDSLLARSLAR